MAGALKAAASAVMAVNGMTKKEETVRVCVRCRPLNKKEVEDGRQRIVTMDPNTGQCTIIAPGQDRNSGEPPKNFTFDQVYDERVTQEYIYQQTASRIVDSVLEGFNGTIFACAPATVQLPPSSSRAETDATSP